MIIFLSLLVALLGLFCYGMSANPKVVQIGLVMFGAGLLAFLIKVGPSMVDLFTK